MEVHELCESRLLPIPVLSHIGLFQGNSDTEGELDEKANSPEAIAKCAVPGQVHFFPAIGNVEAMEKAFESHGCAKLDLKK